MSRFSTYAAAPALMLALAASAVTPVAAAADASSEELRRLIERQEELIRAQDERIRALERKVEAQTPAPGAAAAPPASAEQTPRANSAVSAPSVDGGPEGYPVRGGIPVLGRGAANVVRLEGVLQVDGRYFDGNNIAPGQSQFLVRRARPIVEGTLDDFVDFRFTPDFGGGKTTIQDAYVAARFSPAFALTAGKFKVPFGLERLALDQDLRFIERSLASDLVPNRDIGIEVTGGLFDGLANYALAITDGVADGLSSENNPTPDQDSNNDKGVAGRFFAQPFRKSDSPNLRGLGLGLAATWGVEGAVSATNPLLPAQYSSVGQQSFFKYRASATTNGVITDSGTLSGGRELRLSPQLYYYNGPVGLIGEYVSASEDVTRTVGSGAAAVTRRATLDHKAWSATLSWLVTGEDAAFNYPKVRRPYAVGAGGWGAFELAARLSGLELDPATFSGGAASFANPATAARRATEWGVGINWYLTQHYKIALDYELTRFDGGAAGGRDRPDERAILSRFQVAY